MKIKIILFAVVIIIISFFVLYGIRLSVQKQNMDNQIEKNDQVTSTSTVYFSESGEQASVSYVSNDTAILDLDTMQYQQVVLNRVISASGARYQNTELGLVLWEKAPELVIYKNEEVIYSGTIKLTEKESFDRESILNSRWMWKETNIDADGVSKKIIPQKSEVFSITFSPDGNLRGTTDCNGFGGSYTLSEDKISFGSFMSTLMFCENSQEQEFISMITDGTIQIVSDNLEISTASSTIVFSKE